MLNHSELADKIKAHGLNDPMVLKDYFDLLCSMEDKAEAHRRSFTPRRSNAAERTVFGHLLERHAV